MGRAYERLGISECAVIGEDDWIRWAILQWQWSARSEIRMSLKIYNGKGKESVITGNNVWSHHCWLLAMLEFVFPFYSLSVFRMGLPLSKDWIKWSLAGQREKRNARSLVGMKLAENERPGGRGVGHRKRAQCIRSHGGRTWLGKGYDQAPRMVSVFFLQDDKIYSGVSVARVQGKEVVVV